MKKRPGTLVVRECLSLADEMLSAPGAPVFSEKGRSRAKVRLAAALMTGVPSGPCRNAKEA